MEGRVLNRFLVAASFAMIAAALGGCEAGNQPLTLVEHKPTGPVTTGAGGSTTGAAGTTTGVGGTTTGAAGSTTGAAGSTTGAGGSTTGAAGATEVMPGPDPGPSGGPVDPWIAFDSDGGASNRDIYVIRADGTGRRRLTTETSVDAQPSFSHDGTKLAFASDRAGGVMRIYVMDLATGRTTPASMRSAHDPAFTFDGTRVGYRSGVSVFTVMLDGSDERQVTDGQSCCSEGPFGAPAFESDGLTVYDDYNAIYSTSNGAARHTIVTPTTGEQSHPALSPDGLNIVLQATCGGDNAARSLWTVPATGVTYSCADGHRLSARGTDATHASWGPDNMIVWGSVAGGNNRSSPVPSSLLIWQDGAVRTLTNGNADDRNPSWSPPGTVIGNW
jgi:Tol biopolymer transport system component